jgi:hypothetical protein
VRLPVAVRDRVRRLRAHDGAVEEMDGRLVAARRPDLLRADRLTNSQVLFEIGIPQRDRILVEAVDERADRHPELVLGVRKLDAVLDVRHLLAGCREPGSAALRALHELGELGPK